LGPVRDEVLVTTPRVWQELVLVGRVARPHGIRGHVVIVPETDFIDVRFRAGADVCIERAGRVEELRIEASRVHAGRPIVGFHGIETVEDAEALRDAELRVPPEELPALPAGSFWVHDLVGCRVVTGAGVHVGEVRRVDFGGAAPLLVVTGPADAGEVLVPMVDGICRRLDIAGREIVIDPPQGLLEVNAPARAGKKGAE
jgi:16S rRNA processing protein RimM